MKVKVTYTSDYEDVPSLICSLLETYAQKLNEAAKFQVDMVRLSETGTKIDKIKQDLEAAIVTLDDCFNLARGYVDVGKQLDDAVRARRAELAAQIRQPAGTEEPQDE